MNSSQTQASLDDRATGKTPKLPWSLRSCHIIISQEACLSWRQVCTPASATTSAIRARIDAEADTALLVGLSVLLIPPFETSVCLLLLVAGACAFRGIQTWIACR